MIETAIMSNIYIIYNGFTLYKIGKADDVTSAWRQLNASTGYALEIVASLETNNPYPLKRTIHRELKEFHTQGDWFCLTREKLSEVIAKYSFKGKVQKLLIA